jgi:SH3 domain-containing protein
MTLTPEQYREIADGYERAAIDPSVSPEGKEKFAKKAEWFRFLAEQQRERFPELNRETAAPDYSFFERDRSDVPRPRSFKPILTTLWLVGAVVYFVATLLLSQAVNLSGSDGHPTPTALPVSGKHQEEVLEARVPVAQTNMKQKDETAGVQQPMTSSDTGKHAISLNEPATGSQTVTSSSSTSRAPNAVASVGDVQETSANRTDEILVVTTPAIIRSAPSETAQKIGTATPGAQLQVIERENEWLHFRDPSSGNMGWLQSSLVAAPGGVNLTEADDSSVTTPTATSPKMKRKPKTGAQNFLRAKKPPVPHARNFAGLPPDEEFLPRRMPNPGFFNRRRMLREGLMSPGFVPPQ